MFTPVLEFATSLIFVYLMLSALSSAIQEIVANLAKWRATTLEAAISSLLRDSGVKDRVYNHVLMQGILRPGWLSTILKTMHKPSYLSSSMFAQVLQDLRTTQGVPMPAETQKVLDAVLKGAATADEEKKKIEKWFDDAMDNVSGWYKRKASAWLWVIAVGICGVLNADSIAIGKMLWSDPTARAAMSDAAKKYVNENAQKNSATPTVPGSKQASNDFNAAVQARNDLSALSVPLGWCSGIECAGDHDPREKPASFYLWFLKVVGILLTALAVSQGAPFWFDLLQKFVNLRLAGDQPPDSRTQTS